MIRKTPTLLALLGIVNDLARLVAMIMSRIKPPIILIMLVTIAYRAFLQIASLLYALDNLRRASRISRAPITFTKKYKH